jgi:hypothetical protein
MLDDFQMYLWAQSDRRHRGQKPKPVPRPTDGESKQRKKPGRLGSPDRPQVEAVDVSDIDARLERIRAAC